ncbi:hypothetical protein [Listeria booriae]|uniref:Uncharacterized protein n=1 Tax=Listeria booriae TaxID=1552123 RepID=A0A7X0XM63_9LIST|nr:hypothetical protein [Listeria booriae]MBC1228757.1 hypothetical protein [Listeria booriae]MBC1563613.1 hypothetical protein [Listeria booriae]MBC2164631.1 hypothetical protein [Listeria booriae]
MSTVANNDAYIIIESLAFVRSSTDKEVDENIKKLQKLPYKILESMYVNEFEKEGEMEDEKENEGLDRYRIKSCSNWFGNGDTLRPTCTS